MLFSAILYVSCMAIIVFQLYSVFVFNYLFFFWFIIYQCHEIILPRGSNFLPCVLVYMFYCNCTYGIIINNSLYSVRSYITI